MSKRKAMIIRLKVGLIIWLNLTEYVPEPYDHFGRSFKIKLSVSNFATKTDLKKATWVDTSKLSAMQIKQIKQK